MMQIKFYFNIFSRDCHGLAACQRHTPSSLAAVIGLSNNDVISLRSLRCVRCVGWKPRFILRMDDRFHFANTLMLYALRTITIYCIICRQLRYVMTHAEHTIQRSVNARRCNRILKRTPNSLLKKLQKNIHDFLKNLCNCN